MRKTLPFLIVFVFFTFVSPLFAASLRVEPEFPGPGQDFSVSIDFSPEDYPKSFTWFVDDKAVDEKSSTIKLKAKALGEETKIKVLLSYEHRKPEVLSRSVRPLILEVLYEAETFAPSFLGIAPLSSPGSLIKFHSIVQIADKDSDNLLYIWKENGRKIQKSSGIGKKDIKVELDPFKKSSVFELSILDPESGELLASRQVPIYISKNSLEFYVKDPDSNWAFSRSLKNKLYLNNKEELLAIPFNFSISSLFDPILKWTWMVNGQTIDSKKANSPYVEIDFKNKNKKRAEVELKVQHEQIFLQHASYTLKLERGDEGNRIIHEIIPDPDKDSGFGI